MSKVRPRPLPVKLFIGMISPDLSLFELLMNELQKLYGPVDMEGPVWDWTHTDYYRDEMGEGLKRLFVFFKELIDPGALAGIKIKTIELEHQYLNEKKGRRINIDPGYLDSARVVLASAKDFSHRVYIGNSVYAEATLIYSNNNYQALPYTYPDFKTDKCFELFKKARVLYKQAMGQHP